MTLHFFSPSSNPERGKESIDEVELLTYEAKFPFTKWVYRKRLFREVLWYFRNKNTLFHKYSKIFLNG